MTPKPLIGSDSERARWSLTLFGGFQLAALPAGGRVTLPGKRERALLSYLALSPKGCQTRRKLSTLLWGDAADDTTLDNLRTCVWRLRKALDDSERAVIMSDGDDIVLDSAAFAVDALAFRRLAPEPGRSELETAASLYAGEFLDGLEFESEEFESWRRAEATRYRQQTVDLLARLMTLSDEGGEIEQTAAIGLRILELDPLHEAGARRLMRLYSRSGRRGAAIKLYQSLSATLRKELDSEPEPETSRLFAAIARSGEAQTDALNDEGDELAHSISVQRTRDAPTPSVSPPAGFTISSRAQLSAFAGALIVAVTLISYAVFGPLGSRQPSEPAPPASQTSLTSIAVLPFVNMSGDAGQEFFSDGMTEEITAALAKVRGLRVVARTSAFQFKSQNRDIQAIARQLHASHVLEGSVRRAGDRLRVTAQLVEVSGGMHLWSEIYDRQITDIFAIQEDIARAIATSLRAPLRLDPGENLVNNRSIDPQSYELYLRAKTLFDARGLANLTDASRILEQVVERNPGYGPAWAVLCVTHLVSTTPLLNDDDRPIDELRGIVNELVQKADIACQRAVALDPSFSLAYGASATLVWSRGDPVAGEELFLKALALNPNDSDSPQGYGIRLAIAGRVKDALAMALTAHELDPFAPQQALDATYDLWFNGRTEEAIALARTLRPIDRAPALARIYASLDRFAEAADALEEISSGNPSSGLVREAARLLRTAPAHVASPESLPRFPLSLDFVYLYVGAADRLLDNLERRVVAGYFTGTQVGSVWRPDYSVARKSERFRNVMRKAGYVDYWRAKGWPAVCRPTTGDDFECN